MKLCHLCKKKDTCKEQREPGLKCNSGFEKFLCHEERLTQLEDLVAYLLRE